MTARPIYLDKRTVAEVLSLSEWTIEEMVRQNAFPKPRVLSSKRVGWLLREIEEWAEARPVSALPPPPNTGIRRPRPAAEPPVPPT